MFGLQSRDTRDENKRSIRHDGEGVSLAHRRSLDRAVFNRMGYAGHSRPHEARRSHDLAHFDRDHGPGPDAASAGLAVNPSGRVGKLIAPLPADRFSSGALAALCVCSAHNFVWMAFLIRSRLARRVVLLVLVSNADE